MDLHKLHNGAIAEKMKVTEKTVSQWRNGRGPLHKETTRERIETIIPRIMLPEASSPAEEKREWVQAGYQERRMFTAFVEALRKVDAEGDAHAWRAAWYGVVRAAMLGLSQLGNWGTDKDWEDIHHGGPRGRGRDHWKSISRAPEEDMVLKIRDEPE